MVCFCARVALDDMCLIGGTLLYYIFCFCARVALDDMGLIGGTLLYYIVCFCARVALDGSESLHFVVYEAHQGLL
jgi:hypothetical protein